MVITPKEGSKLHGWLSIHGHSTEPFDVHEKTFAEHLGRIIDQHPKMPPHEHTELAVWATLHDPRHTSPSPALATVLPEPQGVLTYTVPPNPVDLEPVIEAVKAVRMFASLEHDARERSEWKRLGVKAVMLLIALLTFAHYAHAQSKGSVIMRGVANGTPIAGSTKAAGLFGIDCGASTTFTNNVLTCPGTGGGSSGPSDFQTTSSAITMTGSFVTIYSTTIPSLAASACLAIHFNAAVTLANAGDFKIFVDATQIAEPYNGASDISGILMHCNNNGVRNAQTTYYSPSLLIYSGGSINSNGAPNQTTPLTQAIDWTTSHTVTLQIKAASGTATGKYWRIAQ